MSSIRARNASGKTGQYVLFVCYSFWYDSNLSYSTEIYSSTHKKHEFFHNKNKLFIIEYKWKLTNNVVYIINNKLNYVINIF